MRNIKIGDEVFLCLASNDASFYGKLISVGMDGVEIELSPRSSNRDLENWSHVFVPLTQIRILARLKTQEK